MAFVTTVIPVFNGERFLPATLESLARQTRRPDRVVLLDDCSTDQTIEIARGFNAIPIEISRNEKNLGLFENHRVALSYAQETEYLHILHADDLVAPDFFEALLPFLEKASIGAFAYCEHEFIDQNGSRLKPACYPLKNQAGEVSRRQFLIDQSELKAIQLHSAIFKTSKGRSLANFRTDFPQVADVVFHSEWASRCPTIFRTSKVLSQVRLHPTNASRFNAQKLQTWVVDEWLAMELITGLIIEPKLQKILRRQKLKCLWAARSAVKAEMVKPTNKDYAAQITAEAVRRVGPAIWTLGRTAAMIRNAFVERR